MGFIPKEGEEGRRGKRMKRGERRRERGRKKRRGRTKGVEEEGRGWWKERRKE